MSANFNARKDAIRSASRQAWDRTPVLRAEFADNFEAYLAYQVAEQSGAIRMLGGKQQVNVHINTPGGGQVRIRG